VPADTGGAEGAGAPQGLSWSYEMDFGALIAAITGADPPDPDERSADGSVPAAPASSPAPGSVAEEAAQDQHHRQHEHDVAGDPHDPAGQALVVDDADAPITPYIYWIVLDISPATTDIQAGLLPPGARQADNSRGFPGYDAPCPIHGSHKYRFTIYALSSAYVMSSALRLGNGASAKAAWTAIARSAIARGRLTATANGLPNH